ncbi:ATP-binding protein [Brevundimonas sp. NIBR11]|uniref:ATP-binding protein n=1 Tax=Brevundimonas sp. NIBR11 TaxID=3015999 RepID=UPI0022EFFDC0|nr:ATP-binding protein [Brevundimonas sp. NIBR11]WGM29947.1 Sensor histidine kinase RcsC [Brevundimonas sp. NIBR11]
MSEATTNTPPTGAPAIRRRRKALLQRLGMGAATAMVFSPLFGWTFSSLWVGTYFLIQLLEMIVFAPINSGKFERMSPVRSAIGVAVLFLNAAAFGSLSIPLWLTGGPMGGVCAAVLAASGAIYGVVNSPRSKEVLATTLTPHFLYMAATPVWMSWYGAPTSFVTAAAVAFIVFGIYCLSTWQRMNQAADAESAARLDADRRRAEAERAMAGRAAFLATVGHDLRTPISAIMTGAAELEKGATDGAARAQAALITDAGVMMKALLDDLLDHAKLDAGRMTVERVDFNLRGLIAQTLMFWQGEARAKGLTLRVEGAASIPGSVKGDPMRLRQVMNNLVSNAMKFTTEGSVTLRLTAWEEEPSSYAILIEVADTGPGMTHQQLTRLFTPFDQTAEGVSARHGGTGLGLSISRDLAELMGGRLTARSRPGEGAAFTLSLLLPRGETIVATPSGFNDESRGDIVRSLAPRAPVRPAAAPEPVVDVAPEPVVDEAPEMEEDNDRPLRVLVVDDHDINRRAVELILAPLGCDISTAADGLLALAQCETKAFDVIFMDVRMPELDGRETTRRLRAGDGINAGVPVIAVTADTAPDDIAACMAAGMTYFVSKPLTPPALLGALDHVLAGDASEDDTVEIVAA